jgi:hypothetical protein
LICSWCSPCHCYIFTYHLCCVCHLVKKQEMFTMCIELTLPFQFLYYQQLIFTLHSRWFDMDLICRYWLCLMFRKKYTIFHKSIVPLDSHRIWIVKLFSISFLSQHGGMCLELFHLNSTCPTISDYSMILSIFVLMNHKETRRAKTIRESFYGCK